MTRKTKLEIRRKILEGVQEQSQRTAGEHINDTDMQIAALSVLMIVKEWLEELKEDAEKNTGV